MAFCNQLLCLIRTFVLAFAVRCFTELNWTELSGGGLDDSQHLFCQRVQSSETIF